MAFTRTIFSGQGLWLDGKLFCLFHIRFVDDCWYGLTYNVVSCTFFNLLKTYDEIWFKYTLQILWFVNNYLNRIYCDRIGKGFACMLSNFLNAFCVDYEYVSISFIINCGKVIYLTSLHSIKVQWMFVSLLSLIVVKLYI